LSIFGASDVFVRGPHAYIPSSFGDALEVVDISDSTDPEIIGRIEDNSGLLLENPTSVYVSGKYAYVTSSELSSNTDIGLQILDISDPTNPTPVGQLMDDSSLRLGGTRKVIVIGKYAYVCSFNDRGLQIIDISDPSNPIPSGSLSISPRPTDMEISGDFAYITRESEGISIVDISDPSDPILHSTITASNTNGALFGVLDEIALSSGYIFLASDGLQIIDINGPKLHTAKIGNMEASQVVINERLDVLDDAYIRGSMVIGNGGILSQGDATVAGQLSTRSYSFPSDDGVANQVMTTDGSGQLSWSTIDDDWDNNAAGISYTDGNVGIGAGASSAPLRVSFNSGSIPTLELLEEGNDFARLEFQNNTTANRWHIAGKPDNTSSANAILNFWYNETGNVFQIFGDGDAQLNGVLEVDGLINPSDIRLKENITELSSVLDKLENIGGYSYTWISKPEIGDQIGLIAQEVKMSFPELVEEDDQGSLAVNYTQFTAVLLEAIKEQQQMIEQQEDKVREQEEKYHQQEKVNEELEERIKKLEKALTPHFQF